ncbi:putative porin MspA [Nocardia nova SH22a]|uniref:Putative porin MspA n=1 Tax=Nocardia nova SH22a TaxID=1415166 RepID=W5TPF3_9NOCA|nr:MspA family porin [Nocardia nova]AHH21019.1 putative porin MspA [Nocardia nova SH22a]
MRPSIVPITAGAIATVLAVTALWASGTEQSRAQPPAAPPPPPPAAEATGAGLHLKVSVGNVKVDPPGDRTPNFLMTFAHAAQMSGDYAVQVDGAPVTSGQTVAGFILGCAVSVAGGVTVGIEPGQGVEAEISPDFDPPDADIPAPAAKRVTPAATAAAPTSTPPPTTTTARPTTSASPPSLSLGPSVGGNLDLTEVLTAALGPGQVTTATTATVDLSDKTTFPYNIVFNNAALNVAQCASPVSAVPFVTATVSSAQGVVQTTAYGAQFIF